MRLSTFSTPTGVSYGPQVGDYLLDLPGSYRRWATASTTEALPDFPPTLHHFLAADESVREAAAKVIDFATGALPDLLTAQVAFPVEQVGYLPPILRPGKIICLGLNYKAHIQEMGRELPRYPVIFAKFANTLVGHGQPIMLPKVSTMVDYEAELAVVMGRRVKDVAPDKALEYVAGYTNFNDVSVRDFQQRTIQFLQGKTFDTTGPIGPAIVTLDELDNPLSLGIQLRLNGAIMQDSNTADHVFDVPFTISYLSQIMTLEPGDIIATGTPGGVGSAREPKVFLQPGDRVEVEVEGLGVLANPVVGPPA